MPTARRARDPSPASTSSGRDAKVEQGVLALLAEFGRNQRHEVVRFGRTSVGSARHAAAGPDFEHAPHALEIAGERRVAGVELLEQQPDQPASLRLTRDAVVHPVLLAEPLEQAAVVEQLEVARDPRLALAEDLRQLRDRELAAGQHGQQPQPRRLRDRPKT